MTHSIDHSHDLERRMLPGLAKDQFFERAATMRHYTDHTKHYTNNEIERAWWWRTLISSDPFPRRTTP